MTFEEARGALAAVLKGEATPAQIAGWLVALRMKGETFEELAGCATALREAMLPISVPAGRVVVDTCGTGGDQRGTVNLSTMAALVVAGAGVTVAKHGNRSVSSHCGSADVLEASGVNINPGPEVAARCLAEIGLAFLFAPGYHPALKSVMPVRRELGIRTVFNLLGPLANPAKPQAQVIGVYAPEWVEKMAQVLARLGALRALVVHCAGHDEITLTGPCQTAEVSPGGRITLRVLTPEDFGLSALNERDLKGGGVQENAKIFLGILQGASGPIKEAVIANAGAALYVAAQAAGETSVDLKEGCIRARASLESGAALKKFQQLVEKTRP